LVEEIKMKVNTLRIPCRDLVQSEDFYTNLLGLEKSYGSPNEGYVGYKIENADILIENEEDGEFESGRYLGFSIEVPDIHKFYLSSASKGVTFTGPPERQAWGGVMTHVKDCNGNSFSVVQVDNLT